MTDPLNVDARLSPEEVDMIDSYFSRNYKRGERMEVPEECYKEGIKWKERRLRELGFYDRIYHRKKDRVERPASYRPRINLRERERPNNPDVDLDPSHLEFKVWLQHRVELAAAGKGSPRMLQGFKSETDDRSAAMDKWEELSGKILGGLYKRLLNVNVLRRRGGKYDTRAPIMALFVMEEVDRFVKRRGVNISAEPGAPQRLLESIMEPGARAQESFSPLHSICREVVFALFSNCITKRPTDVVVFERRNITQLRKFAEEKGIAVSDDMEKEQIAKKLHKERIEPPGDWGWVRISLTSQAFLRTLGERIADPDHMGKWIRAVHELSKSKQDLLAFGLTDKSEEKIEFDHLSKKGYFGRRGGIADHPKMTQKEKDEKTLHNSIRLSRSILRELARLGIVEKRKMNHEDYLEHSPEGRADKPVEGGYSSILIFEPKFTEWITKSNYASFRGRDEHAIYRWLGGEGDRYMYAPPQDHNLTPLKKDPKPGGYLRLKNRKLIGGGHRVYEDFNHPRCRVSELAVDALNTLQKVQWEVNLDFLVGVFDLSLAHQEGEVRDWTEIKKRITRVDCKGWARDAFYGEDDTKNKERDIALMWSRKIIDHNANVFWHSWACDWRGRLFPRGNGLSPHGDDLDRAMIRFKQWKPLGEQGRKWLFVHVHNMLAGSEWKGMGKDKPLKRQSFEHRDEWVKRNIKQLISLADSPDADEHTKVLGLDEHSGSGSKTFQRLAALIELRRVWLECEENGGDWSKVTSGQPVYLDASCNGYQHVSTLLRNRELARHVNVVPWEDDDDLIVTGDLYQAISDEARGPASHTAKAARRELLSELRGIMPDDVSLRREVMGRLCTRDIAKPAVMTRMYGKESTRDCFMGRRGKGKPGWFSTIKLEDGSYGCPKPECDYTHEQEWVVKSHATKKHHMRSCWHEESPLHRALLRPPVHPTLEKKQHHTDLAIKVDNLFAEADLAVTGGAYKYYKGSVQSIARLATKTRSLKSIKTAKLQKKGKHVGKYKFQGKYLSKTVRLPEWKYAARWQLPDDFKVINYYIKHAEPSDGHANNPTHPASLYKHLLPEWYDLDEVRKSTLARLKELDVPELDRFEASAMRIYSEKLVDHIRKIADDRGGDADLDEVIDILSEDSIHLPRYEENEKDRVWVDKPISSIAPNLIHSLDAYHMRTTITELHKSDWNLDFWAVHDAFGTHARDVPAMRAKIRKGFTSLHHNTGDINWWLRRMTREEMHESVYMQSPSKNRPYVFKDQLIEHAEKSGIELDTVESTADRDMDYSSMGEKQQHEVVYRRRLKREIVKHAEDGGIDLDAVESTARRGNVPTKQDYITALVEAQIPPHQGWLPVPNPNRIDYVDRLLAEGIAPPQEWVAWIDPAEFDKRLTFDARGSEYMVD